MPADRAMAESGTPDLTAFATRFSSADAKSVRALHAWLSSLDAGAPAERRVAQLVAGVRWLSRRGPAPIGDPEEPRAVRRLRLLADVLDAEPVFARAFAAVTASVVADGSALFVFEAGLPNPRGVGVEALDRLARRFLPSVRDPRDLAAVAARLFPSKADIEWLRACPAELLARIAGFIDFAPVYAGLGDAIGLQSTRIAAIGLTAELRMRAARASVRDSAFFGLPFVCDTLVVNPTDAARSASQAVIAACREEMAAVYDHLEEFGVSVDVVYRLELLTQNLDRLALLVDAGAGRAPAVGRELLAICAQARLREHSVRDVWGSSTRLLARKIVEHAGLSGEHYVTRTRREYFGMLLSAAGGGVLTAGTCAFKFMIAWAHFPLFVEGFLASTNYALSFLTMQLFGLTLATKQPSMTAAALAGALKDAPADAPLLPMTTLIARICRSQLAAAIGNVGFVIPAALALDHVWRSARGRAFLDEQSAHYTLHSLHLTHSGTVFFAALTGVLLFTSSLAAGWLHNWATYRRVPQAIAEHRWGRVLGAGTMRFFARRIERGVGGIGGNVALGFLLGMLPVFGKFLGLPLEVRHVTLSTGSLALAVSSLGWAEAWQHGLGAAAAGILVIALFNFGVSFVLALGLALRARAVERGWRRLFRAVLGRLFHRPGEFFFPPQTGG